MLFGGQDTSGWPFGDTWEWDGESWTERSALSVSPEARTLFAMSYDSAREVAVLFGGQLGSNVLAEDTWEWDGESWTERQSETPPPAARSFHAMSYDEERGVTHLFGGYSEGDISSELWEWNGDAWRHLEPFGPAPSARTIPAMIYDKARKETLL